MASIGEHANDSYYSNPTQESYKSISDVLYLAQADGLPPIIMEIQHIMDVDFYLCLISFVISAARQYRTSSILITFEIPSINYEVNAQYHRHNGHSYGKFNTDSLGSIPVTLLPSIPSNKA